MPDASAPQAILLINLGSPDSPAEPDVRAYLDQFLMDERVLDQPWLTRRLVTSLFILPKRPRQSAEAYRAIWTPEGSPLVAISRRVQAALQARVAAPVALGMRYGNPSIESALRGLLEKMGEALREVLVIPLYPHYAMSSYETGQAEAERAAAALKPGLALRFAKPFYQDPDYIDAMVESARPYWESPHDHLLFSFHGLPERHMRKADPTGRHCLASPDCCESPSPAHATCYRHQAFATTREFVRRAGLAEGKYSVSFQSRLGREPWLKPYTDLELPRLAQAGVKRLLVLCPAFVSDCLETLEEIGIRGKADFERASGGELRLIPCMNDHPRWIEALAKWSSSPPA